LGFVHRLGSTAREHTRNPTTTTTRMFNATTSTAALYGAMYGATDYSSLSWLEQQWVQWYVKIGNPVLATGLMSFLLHEVCFVVRHELDGLLNESGRSCTSVVRSPGSSSTPCHTSGSGSCSPRRFLLLRNNGSARSKCCSHTSPSNCLWYVFWWLTCQAGS
jgi:hypothetical protein